MPHFELADNRNIRTAGDEWNSGIAFGRGTNTYKLMRALLSEADRIDNELENIYDAQHIDTSTGVNLDKLGDLVNVQRQSGESDARYRARIKAEFRAGTIETTYDQFVEYCAAVLQTGVTNIELSTNYSGSPAAVTVTADASIYESLNLQPADVQSFLEDGVPAGHEVNVLEKGTFRLKQDGDMDDPDKGLTSDGISTGGTLAADLV